MKCKSYVNTSNQAPVPLIDINVYTRTKGQCYSLLEVFIVSGRFRFRTRVVSSSIGMYGIYNKSLSKSIAWECIRCGMPNFSTSLFDTSLEVSNRFESLSSLSEPDSPIPDNIDPPPPPQMQLLRLLCKQKQNPRPKRRS